VYKIKMTLDEKLNKFKMRLMTKGYEEKVGIDFNETFIIAIKWNTMRLVLALIAHNIW
jgi:hypothetical protein